MDYVYVIVALFVSVNAFTYALWEKKNGNLPGTIFIFFLAVLCLSLPIYKIMTSP